MIAEMIVTAIKLGRDDASRGDLKLINTALKEMRYSNLVFSRHDEPKVTIYGSARLGDQAQAVQVVLTVAGIVPESAFGRDAVFVSLPLLVATEEAAEANR